MVAKENGLTSRISATHPNAIMARSITTASVSAVQTSTRRMANLSANAFQIAKPVTCGAVQRSDASLIPTTLEIAALAKNGPGLSENVSASQLIISTSQKIIAS